MKRFQGEALPESPNIAVIANDALGNYAVSTPLIQMLKSKYPGSHLYYFSGTRVEELWSVDPHIDHGYPLHGSRPAASIRAANTRFDLIINIEWTAWPKCFASTIASEHSYLCGPCLSPDGRGDWSFPEDERGDLWRDQEWISPDLTTKYSFLDSSFIGEIFCRLAYLEGSVPRYAIPSEPASDAPEVLIAMSASLPEKLWPIEKWILLAEQLKGRRVGLLGAKPKDQQQFWKGASAEDQLVQAGLVEDLRGTLSLPQVVGALASADRVITLDNGIVHLAASTGTPTVGLYRHGIHRLWAPPYDNLTVITPGEGGTVSQISLDEVLSAL